MSSEGKSVEERVGILEYSNKDHERRIRIQEENSKALSEISQFVKLQVKHNERQEEQIDNVTSIMQSMQVDVAELKKDVSYFNESMSDVTEEVDEIKKDKTEKLEKKNERRLDLNYKVIAGVLITVIGAAVLAWFGLK